MVVPPLYIYLGAFILAVIILIAWIVRLEIRLSRMLKGKDAKNLEDTINSLSGNIKELQDFKHDSENYLKGVEHRLSKSIRSAEVVRFNAFKGDGSGGNQSFAAAFLNERGDGAIISSIYSRERVSIFAKPVKKLASEYELSNEERMAIDLSKKSIDGK